MTANFVSAGARRRSYGLLCAASVLSICTAQSALAQVPEDSDVENIIVKTDRVGLLEDRPTDSIFGLSKSSLLTPRSLSVISETTIERYAIQDVDDFVTTTPGAFGGSFFGVPGAITLRGSQSEAYFRGFRRAQNIGLYPTPLGNAERVEIVRGATPVIYGAGRIGGLMNITPNTVSGADGEDEIGGEVTVTSGNFGRFNATAKLDLPFELGGRATGMSIYAEYEDSDDFFIGREPQHELVQASFKHDLGGGWDVEVGGMYFNSNGYFQSPGVNRLTQDLVDNGTYITSRDTDITDLNGDGQLNPNEIDAVVGTFFGASNIRTFIDFGVFGFPDAYALDTGVGTAQLDERTIFLAPGFEIQEAETITIYGDLSKEVGNGTAKLQLFYDSAETMNNVSYGFASQQDIDIFEIRGSITQEFEVSDALDVDVHLTASYRSYDSTLQEHFLSGYLVLDRRDLIFGPTATDIFATPLTDPTIPWDEINDSDWSDTGIGLIVDLTLLDQISLLLGGRYDSYNVDAVFSGATSFGGLTEGETTEGDFSFNASLSWNTGVGVVPYITYAEGSEPIYNAAGGINPGPAANEEILFGSDLLEIGVKWELLDGTMTGSLAYYEQERGIIDPFGNQDIENSDGVEIELRYLVNENFTITGAATFQDYNIEAVGTCGSGNGEFVVLPPTHPTVNAFGQTITGAQGYGGLFSALNASCLPELQNGYERNIIPNRLFSLFGTYTSDEFSNGVVVGGTLGGTYIGETGGKIENAVIFPDYVLVRAAAFASYKNFSITATVENLTDERYFQPLQGVYEEVAALPGRGRTWTIIGSVKF
ncbi:MAG: TonB-dependent receptor [Pseudomonadota bacterium]